MSRYDYEYEWDSIYCYPNSHVLKNNLDIHDAAALAEAERRMTALNILEIMDSPIRGKFDLKHLQAIHRYVFQDIYPWAGQLRTVNIAKGNQFCLCQYLETYARDIFAKRPVKGFLTEANAENMAERLTYYLSEINVLHPFREGNGRVQRIFVEYLAGAVGFHVDFSNVSDKAMIEASALSFAKDYAMMIAMFRGIISPITSQEQQAFRAKFGL